MSDGIKPTQADFENAKSGILSQLEIAFSLKGDELEKKIFDIGLTDFVMNQIWVLASKEATIRNLYSHLHPKG